MLIAEEYLLLTQTDDGHGAVSARDVGVSGALLCELAAREKVMVDDKGRLKVVDEQPTGDDALDDALVRAVEKAGKKPKDVLNHIGKDMPKRLLQRLARAEVLQEKPAAAFGVRLWSSWPYVSTTERDELRQELLRVLTGNQQPDARTGSLVALLHATSAWGTALPKKARLGVSRSEIQKRGKEIAQGRWASDAVAKAVEEVAAAATAVIVATAASGGGNGGS